VPSGRVAESATGSPFRPDFGWVPGAGLGTADGLIVGNRPDTLPPGLSDEPAPFSEGAKPMPVGSVEVDPGTDPVGPPEGRVKVGEGVGELLGLGAAVTDTDSAADGSEVTPFALAVAVSVTELTEFAFDATAICA